jgi:ABC-type sugar transport system ATPase subunit
MDGTLDIAATVNTYESLGEEGQLAARIGDSEVLVVTPAFLDLEHEDSVTLSMRTSRVHLFDTTTKEAL